MKITAFILLITCLQVSAIGKTQGISISEKDASLEKVFRTIERQTGYAFFYENKVLKKAKKVDLVVNNADLNQVLNLCFKNQPLQYSIVDKTIVVTERDSANENATNVQTFNEPPPPVEVSGRVTNNAGEPLSGANVIIKRTGKGTITNGNGEFKLNGVNTDDILVVSFIGYQTLNIKIGQRTSFVLLMNTATDKLDEVKIQAYGTTTDRLRTGNITQVTAEEIERHPVMNVLQALQGKVPGLDIVQQSGFASAPFKIEIRGPKYLNTGLSSEPLIIVDGVPLDVLNFNDPGQNGSLGFAQSGVHNPVGGQSPLFSINPNEIESVTVLKDADATAIYGSRGGNGVILISTKKGKAGDTKFDVSVSTGFNENLRWFKLMNTQQYLQMRKEALQNDGITPDASSAPDLVLWDSTRYTDWQRFLYGGSGKIYKVDANASGGNQYTTFRISVGYETQKNITTTSGSNDRVSFSNNFSHNTKNNLVAIELINLLSYTKVNTMDIPITTALLPPNAPAVFDVSHNINWVGWSPVSDFVSAFGTLFNPYKSATTYVNSRLSLSLLPLKGLKLKTSIGYNSFNDDESYAFTIAGQNPLYNPTGSLNNGITKGGTWLFEPQAEYKLVINKFRAETLVGSTINSATQNAVAAAGYGYLDDNLLGSVTNAPTVYGGDAKSQYKYFAIFGRANFNLSDKYIINISGRRDGSSKFAKGKQFGNFWSIGSAWIVSSEKWFQPLSKVLSFAKVRGSFGTVGSDNVTSYAYLTRWTSNRFFVNPYSGSQVYIPTQHANPELQWQENGKLEVAGTFNFLGDKITTEISWYRERVGHQLLSMTIPAMTGFQSVNANLPAIVQNSGVELRSGIEILKTKNVRFSTNFNVGINRNKLYEFTGIENSIYANRYVVGKPITDAYVYQFTGVNPQTGEYVFNDRNHDGFISSGTPSLADSDAYALNLIPKYFGGFGLDVSFKGLSLSSFFSFANNPHVRGILSSNRPGVFSLQGNMPVSLLDRWQKPGDQAKFTSYSANTRPSDITFANSDGIYSNGSYIDFNNLSLSYSFSSKLLETLKMKAASLFVRAENIYIFTKYDGLDPREPGLGSYPLPFTMTFGTNINF